MFPITAGLGALSYLTSLLQSSTASIGSSQSSDPLSQLTQALADSDGDGDQSQTAAASVGSGGTTPPFDPGTLASLISAQGQASGQDPSSLLNAADVSGAKTQTVTNADGSTTTTITYPDGSNVSTTTPASISTSNNGASASSGSGTSSQSNLLEQLVQMQSQFLSQAASTLSTLA
jgi:hypothetical protein